jgi:uncharacterized membrane protein YoaT (DUF817 family)
LSISAIICNLLHAHFVAQTRYFIIISLIIYYANAAVYYTGDGASPSGTPGDKKHRHLSLS